MLKFISILRHCLPASVRQLPPLQKAKNFLNRRLLGHDGVYDAQYYQGTVETPAVQSAPVICQSVVAAFHPSTLIDVGCGTGALMEAFRKQGIQVKGLEYSEAALVFCRQRDLEVRKFDLENDLLTTGECFDVAVSMEVAEHLPEKVADKYVDLLAKLSDVVVFTAARPGQGGQDHVNEQPPSYWLAKFARHGLTNDEMLVNAWKKAWSASGTVASWYYENLIIFRKTERPVRSAMSQ